MSGSIAAKALLAAVTLVLLASIGGAAIFASPILLPLLFVAAVTSQRLGRGVFSLLAALVFAELAWAGVYFAFGEAPVVIWLVPLVAFVAGAVGCFYVSGLGVDEVDARHT